MNHGRLTHWPVTKLRKMPFDPREMGFVKLNGYCSSGRKQTFEYGNGSFVDGAAAHYRMNLYLQTDRSVVTLWHGLLARCSVEELFASVGMPGVVEPIAFRSVLFQGILRSMQEAREAFDRVNISGFTPQELVRCEMEGVACLSLVEKHLGIR